MRKFAMAVSLSLAVVFMVSGVSLAQEKTPDEIFKGVARDMKLRPLKVQMVTGEHAGKEIDLLKTIGHKKSAIVLVPDTNMLGGPILKKLDLMLQEFAGYGVMPFFIAIGDDIESAKKAVRDFSQRNMLTTQCGAVSRTSEDFKTYEIDAKTGFIAYLSGDKDVRNTMICPDLNIGRFLAFRTQLKSLTDTLRQQSIPGQGVKIQRINPADKDEEAVQLLPGQKVQMGPGSRKQAEQLSADVKELRQQVINLTEEVKKLQQEVRELKQPKQSK